MSPDGSLIAEADDALDVQIKNAATRQIIHTMAPVPAGVFFGGIDNLAFSPDGKQLAVGVLIKTLQGFVNIYDVASGNLVRTFAPTTPSFHSLAYSPDGKLLAIDCLDHFELWNAATGSHVATLGSSMTWAYQLVFSPDGSTLITHSADAANNLQWWNVPSGTLINTITDSLVFGECMAISPDGMTLAVGGTNTPNEAVNGRYLEFLDARTGALLRTIDHDVPEVTDLAYSPDGGTVSAALNLSPAQVVCVNPYTGSTVSTIATKYNFPVTSMTFTPNSAALLFTSSCNVDLTPVFASVDTVSVPSGSTQNLEMGVGISALSPDGRLLVTLGVDPSNVT
jgi:WD40 repeat protein